MSTVTPLPKFSNLARLVGAIAAGKGSPAMALEIAESKFRDTPAVGMTLKVMMAAIDAGGTGNQSGLAPYGIMGEVVELQRTASIVGRLAPFARRAPFMTYVPREITGTTMSWVGQGFPIPATNLTLDSVKLEPTKLAVIIVLLEELVKLMSPASEASIIGCLKAGMGASMDWQFLAPEVAEVLDSSGTGVIISPGSIANGATEIVSTGSSAAQKLADLTAMVNALSSLTYPVWILSTRTAMALAGTLTAGDALQFPAVTMLGGTLMGAPVLTTAYMPSPVGSPTSTEHYVVLVDAADLIIADDGESAIDTSTRATVQMVDNPATGATAGVSLFQTSSVGIRISRTINWKRGHDGAVVFMRVSY